MRILFSVLMALLALKAYAAPFALACPATLSTTESAQTPAGWDAVQSSQPHGFDNVTLYAGHPKEMASLAPDAQRRKGNAMTSTWKLSAASDGYWLGCSYSRTTVQLAQRLPPGLSQCVATHTGNDRNLVAEPKLVCN